MGEQTQTTQKPLPCPFCGAENVTIAEGSTYRWAHARCVECGAAAGDIRRQYGQGTDTPEVQEAAIAEWNTRDRREIDGLTRERDIAKRDADILQHVNDEIKRERDEARADLSEALRIARENAAEIARLRPAAEAWEAQQSFAKLYGDYLRGRVSEEDQQAADQKYQAAAARARAAKGAE